MNSHVQNKVMIITLFIHCFRKMITNYNNLMVTDWSHLK